MPPNATPDFLSGMPHVDRFAIVVVEEVDTILAVTDLPAILVFRIKGEALAPLVGSAQVGES